MVMQRRVLRFSVCHFKILAKKNSQSNPDDQQLYLKDSSDSSISGAFRVMIKLTLALSLHSTPSGFERVTEDKGLR